MAALTGSSSSARRQVLMLALPIMLANASVPLVGVVDTAVMGQMPAPAYIGAVAIGATLFSSIFWLFGFLRMGTGGLIAQAQGAGQTTVVQQTLLRSLLLALGLGLLLIALKSPLFSAGMYPFKTTPELRELVSTYYNVRVLAAPATLMMYAIIGTLVGLQRMVAVMVIQLCLNVLNIVLTLVFFHYFAWGIYGVALATLISEYLALGLGLMLLLRAQPVRLSWIFHHAIWDRQSWRNLIEMNANLMIRTLCLIIAFYWLTAASSSLGEQILAANALLIQLLHLMAHALDGFAHTAESLGGQAYGKRNRHEFLTVTRASTECALVFALLFSLIYLSMGTTFFSWMTSLDDVVVLATHYLPWLALAPLISIWSFILDGIFIGVTWSRAMRNGMLVSLLLFIASTLLFIPWLGNHGLWLSYLVLMLARTVTLGARFPDILKQFDQ